VRCLAAMILLTGVGVATRLESQTVSLLGIRYPETRREAVIDTLHGIPVADPYRWLEDGDSPEVQAWEDAQNSLTRSVLDSLPVRAEVLARVKELWTYPEQTAPARYGSRYFFWRTDGVQERWAFCVQETLGGSYRVLIDPNTLSERSDVSLSYAAPSEDGNWVAYGLSEEGTEDPVLHVMNVNTREVLPDSVGGWRQAGVSWTHDNAGFFYTRKPAPGTVPDGDEFYYRRVYYHAIGTLASEDLLVFGYPQRREASCGAEVSEDGRHLLVSVWFGIGNELYLRDLQGSGDFVPITTGFEHYYHGTILDGKLVLRTDEGAPRGHVFSVDVHAPAAANWKEIIPEQDDVLRHLNAVDGKLYAAYSHDTYTRLKVFSLEGEFLRGIDLPTVGSAAVSGRWKGRDVFVAFSSFAFPRTIYRYQFESDTLTELFRPSVEADFSDVVTKLVWYESKDGTSIPMYVMHERGLTLDGSNPTILSGYGGFRSSIAPYFSPRRMVWLERGGVIARPGIRGGAEFGEEWHRAGMLENKQNVFDDFIAAAEWLIDNRYTSPQRLALSGGSNGGLLVGAVGVQRPELFRAVWCGVPLLDMLRYHRFSIARYWIGEYGSAEDPEQFTYLYAYSPYHNVKEGVEYPATLIDVGSRDARVDPMHGRKMAATLQQGTTGDGPIILSVRRESGHGVEMAKSRRMEEVADLYTFLMWQLGMLDE
jgi:prolyl oligopeptidase